MPVGAKAQKEVEIIMRYGCVGKNLSHSDSARIHAYYGCPDYELIPCEEESFRKLMESRDFLGLNVTMPYKETVFSYLDEWDADAAETGAVNTIVRRGEKLIGFNTDVCGFSRLLLRTGVDCRGKKVLIAGSGGTSKTVAYTVKKAGALAAVRLSRTGKEACLTYEEGRTRYRDADILINTTPCGSYAEPNALPLSLDDFPSLTHVIDVVYYPRVTPLLAAARERSLSYAGGLYMLAAQAARASELFTGIQVPEEKIDEVFDLLEKDREN